MLQVQVNGTTLNYNERGAGDGLVLVHGSLSDMRAWSDQLAPFSERYRVIAYSRRYHYPNEGAAEAADYPIALQAEDLAALIRALGLAPAHLVCASYGGCVALLTAFQHPELVRSLVLGEPPLLTWLSNVPGGERVLNAQGQVMQNSARAFAEGDSEKGVQLFIDSVLGAGAFQRLPSMARALLLQNAPEMKLETATDPARYFPPVDCASLTNFQTPTLLLTGDQSPEMFHLIIDELARCVPGAERETIPGASHRLNSMNAPVYNEKVLAFLARH